MKAIKMCELACQYFPNSTKRSAVTQLRRWIIICTPLRERLEKLCFKKGQRVLTPLQHEAIIYYLGEPGD